MPVRFVPVLGIRAAICISIHAPGWGVTLWFDYPIHRADISIHAPGWGATLETVSMHRASIYFNPRTRVGCDAAFCGCSALKTAFQSTHPHGVRPITCDCRVASVLFQSTHPHGVRLPYSSVQQNWFAFQSTHPHGVRLYTS